ncbi:MAG: hypothetical protein K6E58_02470 [Eubacterium sp.]|nr:hypothetical protein [Eubacterium sp.]
MKKARVITISVWMLLFILSIFLLLVIPNNYTNVIWATLTFAIIAFVSQLVLWCLLFKKNKQKDKFYFYPTAVISSFYIFAQLFLCILAAVLVNIISFKVTLIINFLIMIIAWILILVTILSKDYIEKIDESQKK